MVYIFESTLVQNELVCTLTSHTSFSLAYKPLHPSRQRAKLLDLQKLSLSHSSRITHNLCIASPSIIHTSPQETTSRATRCHRRR
jgi:hypothetical protein